MGSKTTQAYLDMRQKILVGEYATDEVLVPRQIEEAFHMNNTTTQILLMRLANEGRDWSKCFRSKSTPGPRMHRSMNIV